MEKKFLLLLLLILVYGCAQKPPIPAPPADLVSCTDSLDCPAQMKCENSVCIDVGCIEEGKTGPSAGINPEWLDHLPSKCCPGLKEIAYKAYFDENCGRTMLVGAPSLVCSNCGNKICEEWETGCNCPEDC